MPQGMGRMKGCVTVHQSSPEKQHDTHRSWSLGDLLPPVYPAHWLCDLGPGQWSL